MAACLVWVLSGWALQCLRCVTCGAQSMGGETKADSSPSVFYVLSSHYFVISLFVVVFFLRTHTGGKKPKLESDTVVINSIE